jgi:lysophospholipase L1-like esterase
MDRIVIAYRPRLVIVYAGDNDIAAGEPAAQIAAEFQQFAERLRRQLPDTRLVYLSIKPSIARWPLFAEMQRANQAIAEYCSRHERCHFVDVGKELLDAQGMPRREFFQDDGLHLNEMGYTRWAEQVRPYLAGD